MAGALPNAAIRRNAIAFRTVALYSALGVAWIFLSDRTLFHLGLDAAEIERWGTVKGLAFIALTSLLIFVLIRNGTRRLETTLTSLADSEERFRLAMMNSREATWERPIDSDRIYLSPGARDLLGFAPDQAMATWQDWESRIDARDRPAAVHEVAALQSGTIDHIEVTYRIQRNGKFIWLRSRGRRLAASSGSPARVIGTVTDVTALREREEQIDVIIQAFRALISATASIHDAASRDKLYESVCEALTGDSGFPLAWIALAEEGPGAVVRIAVAKGLAADAARALDLTSGGDALGRGPTGTAIRTGKPSWARAMRDNPAFAPWMDQIVRFDIDSELAVPITVAADAGPRIIGALAVLGTTQRPVGDFDESFLVNLARSVGYALDALGRRETLTITEAARDQATRQLTGALGAAIESFSRVMERRDPYTAGHQEKVADLSVAIARGLNWDEDRVLGLRMAALLHDIGKIGVPHEILSKPTRLSEAECAIMREHPAAGFEIVRSIDFPWPVARVVLEHHEAWDGSGYPNGLSGEAICPEARIVAVADVIDAVCTHRPYRPALGPDAARDLLREGRGIKFEPAVVDAALALLARRGFPVVRAAPTRHHKAESRIAS